MLQRVWLALALTLPLMLAAWYCWQQRVQALQEANRAAARSVVALEQHTANMLDVHTLILRQLGDLTLGKSGTEINGDARLGETVTSLTRDFPQVCFNERNKILIIRILVKSFCQIRDFIGRKTACRLRSKQF